MPGSGRKTTSLVLQDVWNIPAYLTGDTHVCVTGLAWNLADVTEGASDMNPDLIARMIEDWMPSERYREFNSTSAGLRQLFSYEGDEERRKRARAEIESISKKKHKWGPIQLLLRAKVTDYFPKSRIRKRKT
jgi:hypothetical protein